MFLHVSLKGPPGDGGTLWEPLAYTHSSNGIQIRDPTVGMSKSSVCLKSGHCVQLLNGVKSESGP